MLLIIYPAAARLALIAHVNLDTQYHLSPAEAHSSFATYCRGLQLGEAEQG